MSDLGSTDRLEKATILNNTNPKNPLAHICALFLRKKCYKDDVSKSCYRKVEVSQVIGEHILLDTEFR